MTQRYRTPSLAVKMGYSLKKIGSIILAGTDVSERVKRDTKTFMRMCSKEWSEITCHTAVPCGPKVKNPSTIPFTRDMQVFYNYLEATSASAIESMKTDESQEVYTALCRVTLAQASVLNKCAPEVSKMTLKTFQERDDTTKVLSKNFMRMNILSSRTGENVAILLTSELVSAMTLLVTKREACGVNKDNPFLFAKPNSSQTSHYHGRHCIRPFSRVCCAKNPAHLRSVHHHKHVARVFQILNLENDELRHLAKLLGHEIRPDREYYRLPEAALELAKIAKLLLAMEKGSLERFKGNTLEEIEIEDELEPDGEQYDSENSDAEEDEEESDLQQSDVVEQEAVKKKQKRQPTPEQDAEEHIKAGRDKPFLEEMFIDHQKGRGVFTRESIEPSTFVVEYRGNLLLNKESVKSKHGDTLKNYLYDFSWDGKNWRIDASNEDGTLGRLVNDDHKSPNCKMKKIVYKGKPHLCLFAVKKISADEEITYNYGNTSYPWRSTESGGSQINQNYAASSSDNESFEDAAANSAESCSDDEYKPDCDPSSDESCTSTYTPPCKRSKKDPDSDSSKRRRFEQRVKSDHSSDDDFSSDGDDVEFKDPTQTNKNYCYVCGKAMTKLSRHLFTHRKTEPDIAEAFMLPPGSKERFALLDKLRNKGNLKHNEEVIKTNRGELKVKRKRSNQFTGIQTFAQCLYCKGIYNRQLMWRHMQKCTLKKTKETKCKKQRKIKVQTLFAAAEATDLMSSQVMNLEEIIKKLKNDEIASVVKNDTHILQLAQCLYHVKKGKNMQENITSRLKLLGRLMLTLQKKSISSFEDALKPQNFSHVIDAVKELAGFNEELKTYHTPTLMMKLMTSLKTIGEIKYARALKDNADKQIICEAETFMKLCDKQWRRARPSRSKLSASTVPFIQDVQLLCQYMESTASSAVQSLTMYECSQVFIALLRVTIAQLSIINKNMMKVSKVTVKSFNERDNTEGHGDTADPQPQLEQILSKHYVKLKLVCNKGKEVVAIMTPQLISALTLLVSKRESCGVHANNPFLFGRPSASCSSFFHGHQCMGTCVIRSGAKNTTNLRSVFFHQHIERVFQILSLSDDELGQLAKLLGRSIRTDREYYRTPEAALDIAKVLEILSAMENGSLERLEGKSMEEIEIPDILEPDGQPNVESNEVSDVEADGEQENPENRDAEKGGELSELSLQLSGLFCFSTPKKPRRVSSSRKRGKSKTQKQESEAEPSELNDERNDEVNSEQDDDEMPESCDVDTPEKTVETTEDASKMWFSDDDDDMNVDFDIDTDDDVRNEDNDEDGDTSRSAPIPWIPVEQDTTKHDNDSSDTKKTVSPPNMDTAVSDHEESKDVDEVNNVEQKNRSSSGIGNTEKNKKLLAAMKEVKILVKRLDIGTLRFPVQVSKLSSVCNSDNEKKKSEQLYVKDQTVHDDCNKSPTPSTSTKDKPSSAKEVQMICSHCKKSMLKGQTAYQKKGFTDVFCSKNCLFALFPVNKPITKTCHYCHQAISQPLDLIMAAVDIKGTMKEFCGINCLCAFKYNTVPTQPTQTICRTCKKICTTTHEFTLYNVIHKFCSDACLQDFRRENAFTCANCTSTCLHKPLTLKLEGEETKTICSDECLDQFKEEITTPHKCHVCLAPRPLSKMVHYKSEENVVELFCNRYCVSSYKTYLGCKVQENKSSAQSKEGKRDEQSSEDGKIASDSAVRENDAESEEPSIIYAKSDVKCRQCRKEVQRGQTLYRPKTSQEVFCSASCLSERHPHLKIVQKKCHNCFQVILRPHDMILAPVDDSGTVKELCSNACLASVNSRRNLSAKPTGPRSHCRICGRFSWCRFWLILDGFKHRLCSDACYITYHKANNMPVFKCNICSSICHETRLVLETEDGSKTVCSEECLVKLKKLSDMVESKNKEGKLEFFCSNRCMMVHKAQSVTAPGTGRNSPTLDEIDVKEVKPSLPNLDCIKQEPIEEECNQNLSSSIPPENIKDEPNAAKEDLKIGSVFSLKGEPKATALTQDLPVSCSNCKNVLMDGETVYQRKGRADIFCSTSCLLKFYQMKQAMKTCHFCLQ
ncbi:Zinc finger MYM-type protein 4 [Larimichthys crocea]|uniref:Uncharacterized protein n=1 Tax=Larimichthys crocea TaxID=215358 RepID=A0ACD3RJ19_LARCR|nr:Zinc finger MYM-type protein 4 [Larimichthys crocea]